MAERRLGGSLEEPLDINRSITGAPLFDTPEQKGIAGLSRDGRPLLLPGEGTGVGDPQQESNQLLPFIPPEVPVVEPERRGVIGETAAAVGRGVEGLGALVNTGYQAAFEALGIEGAAEAARQGAEYWKSAQRSGFTAPDPETFRGTFLENPSVARVAGIIGEASTSYIPILAAGALTGPVGALAAGGALEGLSQYQEAREAGASVEDSQKYAAVSFAGGAILEGLPVARLFKRAGRAGRVSAKAGATGKQLSSQVAKDFAVGAVEEGLTEAAQNTLSNSIAQYGYEPTRDLFEGLIESVIGGVGLGGPAGATVGATADLSKRNLERATTKQREAEAALTEAGAPPEEIEVLKETMVGALEPEPTGAPVISGEVNLTPEAQTLVEKIKVDPRAEFTSEELQVYTNEAQDIERSLRVGQEQVLDPESLPAAPVAEAPPVLTKGVETVVTKQVEGKKLNKQDTALYGRNKEVVDNEVARRTAAPEEIDTLEATPEPISPEAQAVAEKIVAGDIANLTPQEQQTRINEAAGIEQVLVAEQAAQAPQETTTENIVAEETPDEGAGGVAPVVETPVTVQEAAATQVVNNTTAIQGGQDIPNPVAPMATPVLEGQAVNHVMEDGSIMEGPGHDVATAKAEFVAGETVVAEGVEASNAASPVTPKEGDPDVSFTSSPATPKQKASSVASIRQMYAEISKFIKASNLKIPVKMVATITDPSVPAAIRAAAKSQITKGFAAQACYYDGNIYLFLDRFGSTDEALKALVEHEIYHAGFRSIEGYSKIVDSLGRTHRQEIVKFAKQNGIDLSSQSNFNIAVEEWMVNVVESGQGASVVARLHKLITEWLRSIGFEHLNITKGEIQDIMVASARAAAKGASAPEVDFYGSQEIPTLKANVEKVLRAPTVNSKDIDALFNTTQDNAQTLNSTGMVSKQIFDRLIDMGKSTKRYGVDKLREAQGLLALNMQTELHAETFRKPDGGSHTTDLLTAVRNLENVKRDFHERITNFTTNENTLFKKFIGVDASVKVADGTVKAGVKEIYNNAVMNASYYGVYPWKGADKAQQEGTLNGRTKDMWEKDGFDDRTGLTYDEAYKDASELYNALPTDMQNQIKEYFAITEMILDRQHAAKVESVLRASDIYITDAQRQLDIARENDDTPQAIEAAQRRLDALVETRDIITLTSYGKNRSAAQGAQLVALKESAKGSKTIKAASELFAAFNTQRNSVVGPYAPLSRFGDYAITYIKDGVRVREHFESGQDWENRVDVLKAEEATEAGGVAPAISRVSSFRMPTQNAGKDAAAPPEFVKKVSDEIMATWEDLLGTEELVEGSPLADLINEQFSHLEFAVQEMALDTLPDYAAMQNSRTRQSVQGFSYESTRALGSYVLRQGSAIANLEHGAQVDNELSIMQQYIQDRIGPDQRVEAAEGWDQEAAQIGVDKMRAQVNKARNAATHSAVQKVLAFSTAYYLFTPFQWLQQQTQVMALTAPRLARRLSGSGADIATSTANMHKAGTSLIGSMRDVIAGKFSLDKIHNTIVTNIDGVDMNVAAFHDFLNERYSAADAAAAGARVGGFKFSTVEKEAMIDEHITGEEAEYHKELLALMKAKRDGTIDLGMAGDIKDLEEGLGRNWRAFTRGMTWFTSQGETHSRIAAFVGSVRAGKAGTTPSFFGSFDLASKVVDESLYIYAKFNKPEMLQGSIARLATQFMTYRMQTMWLLVKNMADMSSRYGKGLTAQERKAAMYEFGFMNINMAAMAGVKGVPIYLALKASAEMFAWLWSLWTGEDEEAFNFDLWMYESLNHGLGQGGADAAMWGAPTLAGANVSDGVGLGRIFEVGPSVGDWAEGSRYTTEAFASIFGGPVVALAGRFSDAKKELNDGNYLKAGEKALPNALGDALKVYSSYMKDEGYRANDGTKIMRKDEFDLKDWPLMMLGINPEELSIRRTLRREVNSVARRISGRRGDLVREGSEAILAKDWEQWDAILAEVKEFNTANPTVGIGGGDFRSAAKSTIKKDMGIEAARSVLLQQKLGVRERLATR